MPSKDQILEALKVVIDPELRRSIVELGMVRSIDVKDGGVVDVTVSLTTAGCPIKNHFQTAVADAAMGLDGVEREADRRPNVVTARVAAVSGVVENAVQAGTAAGQRVIGRVAARA